MKPAWPAIKWLWLTCALWGLLLSAGLAKAEVNSPNQDLIVQRAYWEDLSAQASFATAQQKTYTPFQGIFSRGYTEAAHWVRLTLAPSPQALALLITPSWLDSITLYDPAHPDAPNTVGDRHALRQNALPGLGHSIELPPSAASRNVWLRVQTTSSTLMHVQAIPLDQVPQHGSRQILWASLYLSVLLLILVTLVSIWWVQRDRVLGFYILRHAFYTVYGAAYLGLPAFLLSHSLPPSFFDLMFSICVTTMLPVGIWFDVAFLSGYKPQRHLLALLKTIGVLSAGIVLILLSGHALLALQVNALALMTGTLTMALTALSCKPDPQTEQLMPSKVMITYYAVIFSNLLIGVINTLGWFKVQPWTLYALILHGMVSGVLMTIILMVRAQRMAQQNKQMTWKLQQAERDMAQERQRRQEQSQFLHMLMHELKTPLSIVSLALGTQTNREENLEHASRAIQDMKAIIDRCVQADQIGQLTLVQHRQTVDLPKLIQQLGHQIPGMPSRLQLSASPGLPRIQADQQLLQIVLNNLLDNAVRYSDPLTPVTVSVQVQSHQNQSGLCVRVGNTPGMAGWPDEHKLFDKYYRAVGAQRDSGSGLGLFLSRQLAQSLAGSLDYAPSTQQVEFVLWIPRSPA